MKRRSKKHTLPSARLVMNILNREKGTEDEVVDFYERYIKEMATDPVYAADGSRTGYFYDEDPPCSRIEACAVSEPSCGS